MKLKITEVNGGKYKGITSVDLWTDSNINYMTISESEDKLTALIKAKNKLEVLIKELDTAIKENM
jgi:hypothetical protein